MRRLSAKVARELEVNGLALGDLVILVEKAYYSGQVGNLESAVGGPCGTMLVVRLLTGHVTGASFDQAAKLKLGHEITDAEDCVWRFEIAGDSNGCDTCGRWLVAGDNCWRSGEDVTACLSCVKV